MRVCDLWIWYASLMMLYMRFMRFDDDDDDEPIMMAAGVNVCVCDWNSVNWSKKIFSDTTYGCPFIIIMMMMIIKPSTLYIWLNHHLIYINRWWWLDDSNILFSFSIFIRLICSLNSFFHQNYRRMLKWE